MGLDIGVVADTTAKLEKGAKKSPILCEGEAARRRTQGRVSGPNPHLTLPELSHTHLSVCHNPVTKATQGLRHQRMSESYLAAVTV